MNSFYDIVITDIMMPKMNGIELLESIREVNDDVKVIVMTGYPTKENIKMTKKYNASAFFTKPLDVEIFMDTITKMENKEV